MENWQSYSDTQQREVAKVEIKMKKVFKQKERRKHIFILFTPLYLIINREKCMENPCMQWRMVHIFFLLNPLTPVSDQERISPHQINTISNRQVMRKKIFQLRDY